MNPLADALQELLELGVTGPALVATIRRLEQAAYGDKIKTLEEAVNEATRRADNALHERRERKERDAARKRKERMSADCPVTSEDIQGHPRTSEDNPPPPSFSPKPPQPPTPTRECISTQAREAAFDRFWDAYPKKVGKGDAKRKFEVAAKKLGPGFEVILTGALERAKATWEDAQFIPNPATWLHQERWEDEPTSTPIRPRQANVQRPDDRRETRNGIWAEIAAEERGPRTGLPARTG